MKHIKNTKNAVLVITALMVAIGLGIEANLLQINSQFFCKYHRLFAPFAYMTYVVTDKLLK